MSISIFERTIVDFKCSMLIATLNSQFRPLKRKFQNRYSFNFIHSDQKHNIFITSPPFCNKNINWYVLDDFQSKVVHFMISNLLFCFWTKSIHFSYSSVKMHIFTVSKLLILTTNNVPQISDVLSLNIEKKKKLDQQGQFVVVNSPFIHSLYILYYGVNNIVVEHAIFRLFLGGERK